MACLSIRPNCGVTPRGLSFSISSTNNLIWKRSGFARLWSISGTRISGGGSSDGERDECSNVKRVLDGAF